MSEFLIYTLKTAVCLAVFYLFYKLLLSKESYHRLNRIVLLVTSLVSFILPFCVITITKEILAPLSFIDLNQIPILSVVGDGAGVGAGVGAATEGLRWAFLPTMLFYMGIAVSLMITLVSIIKVTLIIRRGKKERMEDGSSIIVVKESVTPFSWFNNIVLSESDYDQNAQIIIAHEEAHVRLHHSWDILLVNLITCLQWFNPVVWLLKQDLKAIHEYEADQEVLKFGFDAKQYQLLLIKKAVGSKSYSIANSLNHSTLKNRITMMLSKKSTRASRLKVLYVLPLMCISLAAFAQTKTVVVHDKDNQIPEIREFEFKFEGDKFAMPYDHEDIKGDFDEFGYRLHPITKKMVLHKGVDIWLKYKAPIYSIFDGTVTEVRNGKSGSGYGKCVVVTHKKIKDYSTFYAHLSSVDVKEGQEVSAGEQIGKAGKTGGSTGVHLHLELRRDGEVIDPATIIDFENGTLRPTISTSTYTMSEDTDDAKILVLTNHNDATPLYIIDGKEISKEEFKALSSDKIASFTVLKDKAAIEKYGEKAKDGVILIKTKKEGELSDALFMMNYDDKDGVVILQKEQADKSSGLVVKVEGDRGYGDGVILMYVDGKEVSDLENISHEMIASMGVLPGGLAIEKYGEEAKYGVLEIVLKKEGDLSSVTVNGADIDLTGKSVYVKYTKDKDGKPTYVETKAVENLTGTSVYIKYTEDKESKPINITAIKDGNTYKFTKDNDSTGTPTDIVIKGIDKDGGGRLYIIDGKEVGDEELEQLLPEMVGSMTTLKDEAAVEKFGVEAKDGVIMIKTKKDGEFVYIDVSKADKDSDSKPVYVRVEGKDKYVIITEADKDLAGKAVYDKDLSGKPVYVRVEGEGKDKYVIIKGADKDLTGTLITPIEEIESFSCPLDRVKMGANPLYVVDDKEISEEEFKTISAEKIDSISSLTGKEAIEKYGEKAKDGVIIIKTKKVTEETK